MQGNVKVKDALRYLDFETSSKFSAGYVTLNDVSIYAMNIDVFADLLGIASETVTTYQDECQRMVRDLGYTHIRFDDLENHLVKDSARTAPTDQAELMRLLLGASTAADVEAQIASDADLLKLHQSMKCFLRLDLEPINDSEFPGVSRRRMKQISKAKCNEVSISMMLRNMVCEYLTSKTKILSRRSLVFSA
jgi:pyoverdine/dityrosine biosynthesis protein Dit1